jgi:chemotaxis signal transduction protein/nucleoid-associated protein YgaU
MELLAFEVAGNACALPLGDVREILTLPYVTRIPGAPAALRGVVNVRGQVLPVLDVAVRLGAPPSPRTRSSVLLRVDPVVNGAAIPCTLLVDAVSGLLAPEEGIVPRGASGPLAAADAVSGFVAVVGGFALVLDPARLLDLHGVPAPAPPFAVSARAVSAAPAATPTRAGAPGPSTPSAAATVSGARSGLGPEGSASGTTGDRQGEAASPHERRGPTGSGPGPVPRLVERRTATRARAPAAAVATAGPASPRTGARATEAAPPGESAPAPGLPRPLPGSERPQRVAPADRAASGRSTRGRPLVVAVIVALAIVALLAARERRDGSSATSTPPSTPPPTPTSVPTSMPTSIPTSTSTPTSTPTPTPTPTSTPTSAPTSQPTPPAPPLPLPPPPAGFRWVVVEPGNTLWQLAGRHRNDPFSWPVLYRANGERVRDPDLIHPGQRLVVPEPAPRR